MVHWSKGPPGVLCVQHAEGGVVVDVVEVVGVQSGSPGCIVQVQVPAVHWSRIAALQALRAAPDKPAHPAAISSAHCFEPQSGGAALAPETKTPAPSATAANVTTALRVIVEPPYGRSNPKIVGALPPRVHSSTRLSRGESPPHRTDEGLVRARARSDKPVPADTSAVRCSRARTARSQDTSRRRR
jgi:hypothetical protein